MSQPKPATRACDVFISYNSDDVQLAEDLHRRLVEAGLTVWFDKARLDSGCQWHKAIEAGCNAARVKLPVLTPRWRESDWTKYETYGSEFILPLHCEGAWDEVATPPLAGHQSQSIDLHDPDSADWEALFAAIRRLLARPAPEKAPRLAKLRYRPNPNFVGRECEMNAICEALHRCPTTALTQGSTYAIAAAGGIGKTTLAREYAERFWRLYEQILWVDCRNGVESEFARLAGLLCSGLDTPDAREKAQAVLRALNGGTERLLILDNAEDEESVQAWIPKSGGCHTIITSRFAAWSAAVETRHIYVLEPEPARALLLRRAGRPDTEANCQAADTLAEKLGYLPLALEQAASFIAEEGAEYSFSDYLALYEEATTDLLTEGVLGSTEYPDSVMTTWRATVERLSPMARAMLRLSAFLSPEPIPNEVFTGELAILQERAAVLGGSASSASSADFAVRRTVKELARYSMVTRHGHGFSVHALVQTVQRLEVPETELRDWVDAALRLVRSFDVGDAPSDVRNWPRWDLIGSHVAAVVRHCDAAGITDGAARLMSNYATVLNARCQFGEAEPLMRRALAIDEALLDANHPTIATRLNNLAQVLQDMGRTAEAEPLMWRALAIYDASCGKDHSESATCLTNLGHALRSKGRFAEAEPPLRRALAIDEASLRPNHPDIARDLNNLATLLHATNRLAEAEPLLRRALAVWEASHGGNHPQVAAASNNLAWILVSTYCFAEAEPLMRKALAIWEGTLGEEHPEVATVLNGLAQLLQVTNRLAEAEPLMRRVVALFRKFKESTGSPHEHMEQALSNYGHLLLTMGLSQEQAQAKICEALEGE
ncbi:tetratricopeptide repeat protein [bacterium]|nr:tetratricopeptide repeat protein [bacterium]